MKAGQIHMQLCKVDASVALATSWLVFSELL